MSTGTDRKISFHFSPYQYENKLHYIEKAAKTGEQKHRYVAGLSSGIKTDAHEERMTPDCIKDFMAQANSGDILLYADLHGIRESEDIGILTKAEILDDGDWYTEYRLYDESDDIGANKLEKINDIWKQITGAPPYKAPKQKGFSIEGIVPEDGIESADVDKDGNPIRRVLKKVMLDGVVLVPRPAYKDGIANAIYKALGETPPWQKASIKKSIADGLAEKVKDEEMRNGYYRKRWDVQDVLDREVEKLMRQKTTNKEEKLGILFDEYKSYMVKLLMESETLFQKEGVDENQTVSNAAVSKTSKVEVLKSLYEEMQKLVKIQKGRKHNG